MNWTPTRVSEDDIRFKEYGKLAPKSKADFAFVQHMIYQLKEQGIMAVILPHGLLFRGASESVIRRHLVAEMNCLDAVIGLPADLYYNTAIPTCLLIFKKIRPQAEKVLFIDASNDFVKDRIINTLSDEQITKIVDTYVNYTQVERFANVVTIEELQSNDFNLNISRYVDTSIEEEPVDIIAIENRLTKIKNEINSINIKLDEYMKFLKK